ncbi:patatin-like phospholipase family protein [Natranaerofaba carboxydovora]|uniref:patatin-like phospholipase family protein n=1 Tax=Natranaerofaba carboxydovora TaxID=2742683 RepID=UPI001F147FEA|nr:patatin-like phospholipase family protein [Natranaerofaba carboxydovora]UMZ72934.1 Patatin-like phospholipase [Natranaerofaba carboxydovora]
MTSKKKINLALQGGGSHGAFTWGVLDRILEIDELEIKGVSGTSAGAVNATLAVYGLLTGGRDKAKELLNKFWKKNAVIGSFSLFQPTPLDKALNPGSIEFNPFYHILSFLSPYHYNPFNLNPIEYFIKELVDFDTIQADDSIKLFLSATNIRNAQLKVFDNKEITPEAVIASCALPQFFHTVKIGNEHYWDGGFVGNPAIFPVLEKTDCNDLMIVQVQYTNYEKIPTTPLEIEDRVTSISFNSSLMRELHFVNFINKLVEKNLCDTNVLRKIHLHLIDSGEVLKRFNVSSKANPTWKFVHHLKEKGREEADKWINENYDKIGKMNSFDVDKYFSNPF